MFRLLTLSVIFPRKKYQNPFTCVKVIASQRWGIFWDTVYAVRCWNADPTPNPYTTNLKEVLTTLRRYLRQRCTNFDANSIRRIQFIAHLLIIWHWLSPFNTKKQQRVSYSQWLILYQVWSQRISFLLMLRIDIHIYRKQTHSQTVAVREWL